MSHGPQHCTWGRRAREAGWAPRMTTLDTLPVDFLGRAMSTTDSLAASACPSPPRAISGRVVMAEAAVRSMPLCTSVSEPLRSTMALPGEPVETSVWRRPSASISVAVKTKTTSAMPPAVSTVVSRRVLRLRQE